jgi:hypothetical protein
LFEELLDKSVAVTFTAPDQSCDGGVLLLKGIDEKMGLTERMAQALPDGRQAGKVEHPLQEMFLERILGISCGYPDANDAARLSRDPAMQMACERRGESLASQPTLSRLENAATSTGLMRMAYAMTDSVIERERQKRARKRVRRITIDMDPTEDPTYGGQQLTFFSGFYDNWCYLPMVTTVQFGEEPEHYLVAPLLRPGNAAGKWKRERRVIVKAEIVALEGRALRDNPRFLITNLSWKPKKTYRFYAHRGDAENRIKELKDGLRFDLTSCTSFRANQFRNLLVAAAYALCQQLRHEARGTTCERAQVATLRERLLKLAVTIRETARRIWIEAPKTYAWLTAWRTVALRVGAVLPAAGP